MNPDGEIWLQETRNIPVGLLYGVKHVSMSWTHECDRYRDRRTDSLIAYAVLHYVVRPKMWPTVTLLITVSI